MILSKNWHFLEILFFFSKASKILLYYLLEGEQGVLDCKNVLFTYLQEFSFFTLSKKCIFAKGLTYDFSQKLDFCQSMFFLSKRQNRLFDYVLDRKNRFLDYKNVLFTRSKNCIFAKGLTHDFSQKLAFLSIYVFLIKTPK